MQEPWTSTGWVSTQAWAFTVLDAESGEAAQGPPGLLLPQAHKCQGRPSTEDSTHLQPWERTKRNNRQSLPLWPLERVTTRSSPSPQEQVQSGVLSWELKQTSSSKEGGFPALGLFPAVSELFKHRKSCLSTKGQVVLASSPTQSPSLRLCRRLSPQALALFAFVL